MNHHFEFLRYLLDKGGPDLEDYYDLDAWISEIVDHAKNGRLLEEDIKKLIEAFGDAFSVETMQGFAFKKPHGYAGDYEILDRIYQRYISNQFHLSKWDEYWQSHPAAEAVRNRVQYLGKYVKSHVVKKPNQQLEVLNLASGPGRDMLQFFESNPNAQVLFDCIEQDKNAVNYAKELCKDHLSKIRFVLKNALRFQSNKRYDLIWSAGLFDYFEDKVFVFMLKKLRNMVADGGEIVIGNFSTKNPSKPYMELFDWHLHHRSPPTLKALANAAGFDSKQIRVKMEVLGVNLFLHIYPIVNDVV